MSECIQVKQYVESDDVLQAEGPLDEEPNFPESYPTHGRTDSGSASSDGRSWSATADAGSLMHAGDA